MARASHRRTSRRKSPTVRRTSGATPFEILTAWRQAFHPFQQEWLADGTRFSITNKARQIGASHTTAAKIVTWALQGETTTIVSKGERESLEVLDFAKRHAEVLYKLGLDQAATRPRGGELRFPRTGGRIIALPNSSGGRGFSGNVFLDEFAYYDNAEQVWDAAAGSATLGYRVHVSSTPNGVGNLHHTLWQNAKRDGWTQHQTTIEEAIAQGYPVDLAGCWKLARGDERVFNQLYRCCFLDNNLAYFPTQLLDAVTIPDCAVWEGDTFAGLDVGRVNDRTTLVILREMNGVLFPQAVLSRPRTEDEDLDDLADLAFNTFGCRRLAIDATGMGAFPSGRLVKKWGSMRVEPVEFTLPVKEDLMTGLFARMVEQSIRLDAKHERMRLDLMSVRRIITAAGNVRYDAPTTADGHADEAWSLALANHAASRPRAERTEQNR